MILARKLCGGTSVGARWGKLLLAKLASFSKPIQVPAAPLMIQLSANAPGKSVEGDPIVIHMQDLYRVPDSRLCP